MTIQVTNELVDLFFRESGRMGVRGAIEALLEKVNEEIERDYVPRWGTVQILVAPEFVTDPEGRELAHFKAEAQHRAKSWGATIPNPDDFEILNPKGMHSAMIEWRMRRND